MQDETVISAARQTPATEAVARIGLDNGISFNIDEASLPLQIGRGTECDICIPSGHVSRKHCELYMINGVLCLKDTSSNGTVIDKRVVKQASVSILEPTNVVFAGEVTITISPRTPGKNLDAIADEDNRGDSNRRGNDRRRRQVIVNFERRAGDDRRLGDRRA